MWVPETPTRGPLTSFCGGTSVDPWLSRLRPTQGPRRCRGRCCTRTSCVQSGVPEEGLRCKVNPTRSVKLCN